MSPKTETPTKQQVDKALWTYVALCQQYEASGKKEKKSKKLIQIETEIARARVLRMDCERTARQVFNYIYARLPSEELKELFGIYGFLTTVRPQISEEAYKLFKDANNKARRMIGATEPGRRAK